MYSTYNDIRIDCSILAGQDRLEFGPYVRIPITTNPGANLAAPTQHMSPSNHLCSACGIREQDTWYIIYSTAQTSEPVYVTLIFLVR